MNKTPNPLEDNKICPNCGAKGFHGCVRALPDQDNREGEHNASQQASPTGVDNQIEEILLKTQGDFLKDELSNIEIRRQARQALTALITQQRIYEVELAQLMLIINKTEGVTNVPLNILQMQLEERLAQLRKGLE